MKQKIKKWAIRLTVTALLIAGLLLTIILNPILTYANRTSLNNFTIYHNQPIDNALLEQLNQAAELLKTSEFYNPKLKLDICLNDGSLYPKLIENMRGKAFAWGFYNKVIMQGRANYPNNYVALNGYKWNLTELLAHEMTHCLQFDKLGLGKSNPIAHIAVWKWEGYAEYIARQNKSEKELSKNIERLLNSSKESWEIVFADSSIAPRLYYNYWTLLQYCMDIKKMSYKYILSDTTSEETIRAQMMEWYEQQKNKGEDSVSLK